MRKSLLLWALIPLATAVLVLFHPIIDPWGKGTEGLRPLIAANARWLIVHALLLALFPLTALALSRTIAEETSIAARTARWALAVFAIDYAAFDTFAGLATGALCRTAGSDAAAQASALKLLVSYFNEPVLAVLFLLGTAAWLVGSLAVAVALWRKSRAILPAALIVAAGLLLFLDHPPPYGPVTFALVALAIASLGFTSKVRAVAAA